MLVALTYPSVHQSDENGEKSEKEAKPEPEEEQEEKKQRLKQRKARSKEEEGFVLWNELEVQRNKFMVITVIYLYTPFTVMN